jgi:hypothetical protein
MNATYRDNAALTLAELEALAEAVRPEASRCEDALRRAQRAADMHTTAATGTILLLIGAVLMSAGCAAFRWFEPAALAGISALVALLALVVQAVLLRWRFARFYATQAAYTKARRAWHVATSRVDALRWRLRSPDSGRCGCDDCEADPLGFFPPYTRRGQND